jgi:hypothetical protein
METVRAMSGVGPELDLPAINLAVKLEPTPAIVRVGEDEAGMVAVVNHTRGLANDVNLGN